MPITRPLIAVDLSDAAEAAARWTARVITPGAAVTVGHVVDVPQPPRFLRSLFPAADDVAALARQGARAYLDAVCARTQIPHATIDVRTGHAVESILAMCAEHGSDAIVLGPHGKRDGLATLIGATAIKLARQAGCPVIVVRGPRATERPMRILVAVDDSPAGRHALRWAAQRARELDVELNAVTVVNPMLVGALGVAASEHERTNAVAQLRTATAAWLAELVGDLADTPTKITTTARVGRTADTLLAAIDECNADLVVVGRGSAARSNVLGSVADAMLRYAAVSTVVIPGSVTRDRT
jgi:nucleotide-binding universal stress UspA family protein